MVDLNCASSEMTEVVVARYSRAHTSSNDLFFFSRFACCRARDVGDDSLSFARSLVLSHLSLARARHPCDVSNVKPHTRCTEEAAAALTRGAD